MLPVMQPSASCQKFDANLHVDLILSIQKRNLQRIWNINELNRKKSGPACLPSNSQRVKGVFIYLCKKKIAIFFYFLISENIFCDIKKSVWIPNIKKWLFFFISEKDFLISGFWINVLYFCIKNVNFWYQKYCFLI